MRIRTSGLILGFILLASAARADVAIETSVSRSQLPVGEQLVLDIIISDADGRIEQPRISSIDGFTSYSQGHSQELSIINGRSSSRSVYSYVLVANSTGEKTIGPFEVVIAGKEYKIAPVKVDVTRPGSSSAPAYTWTQGPVSQPSPRAMPRGSVDDQDIFVKAWVDKDEAFINEPVMITYTLFTRMSATYKGFEKEPVTTGFWVEDFPPEKTIRRTEQFLNGQRYVVADVRKLALFPTQAGMFTLDAGTLSATVELRNEEGFNSFFSSNVFGSRRTGFPGAFMSEIVPKVLSTDPIQLVVKALPETGKPADFSGAVGQYEIESSLDKDAVESGDPVTLRVRIKGRGNINTVQAPKLPRMDDFKVYESSSSTNISKARLVVEGEKVTETVIVPRKPGTYEIPPMTFTFFDSAEGNYRTVKTETHILRVSGTAVPEPAGGSGLSASDTLFGLPEETEQADLVAKDIRYIKTVDDGKRVPERELHRNPIYWLMNVLLLFLAAGASFLSGRRAGLKDEQGSRRRRSHSAARAKLKTAARLARESKSDEFYAELSRAVAGYFADKFNIPAHGLSLYRVEELAQEHVTAEQLNKIRKLFEEMSMGRFSRSEKTREDMQELCGLADEVISSFEKVRLK